MSENDGQNGGEPQAEVKTAFGIPVGISISVGPGVLVEGAPVGNEATLFLHDGCIHSLILKLEAVLNQLVPAAYETARQQAETLQPQEEGTPDGTATGGLVA